MKKQIGSIGSNSAVCSLFHVLYLCWHQSSAFWCLRMFTQVCPGSKALCRGSVTARPMSLGKPDHRETS